MSIHEKSTDSAGSDYYPLAGLTSARELFNLRSVHRDAALVVPHLHSGMRIVDFGCGAGSLTCGFAEIVAPGEVVGFDVSEDAIARARAMAEQLGLTNVQFSAADINDLDLPPERFDVAHFSGVLAYLKEPDRGLQLAFRSLKASGMLAAREAQKEGDWFGGPYAESIALYFRVVIESHRAHAGDPALGRRLPALAREAGFARLEATPSYSAGLSNVKATAATMLSVLDRPDFRATAMRMGISAEQFNRLGDEIAIWADSPDSIAAFAECTVIGWKP